MAEIKKTFIANIDRLNEMFSSCLGFTLTVERYKKGWAVFMKSIDDDSKLTDVARRNLNLVTRGMKLTYILNGTSSNFRLIKAQTIKSLRDMQLNRDLKLNLPRFSSLSELQMKMQLVWGNSSNSFFVQNDRPPYSLRWKSSDDPDESIFSSCDNLLEVSVPEGFETIPVCAFRGCNKLVRVTLPESLVKIPNQAFEFCSSLRTVEFPSRSSRLTTIGDYAFGLCTKLSSVKLPDSVERLGAFCFHGCTSLTDIEFGHNIKDIEEGAFESCDKLTKIVIPDSTETIHKRAFRECSGLTEIHIGANVEKIDSSTFAHCPRLQEVFIPKNVRHIGKNAFGSCYQLESVKVENPDGMVIDGEAFCCCRKIKINLRNVTLVWE